MVTKGQARYMRCRLATDDVLTQIMREYMEESGTPYASIQKSILDNKGFLNRFVYPDEKRIIQTLTTNGFEHFSISLMYRIARNDQSLISDKPPKWGTIPQEDDCTVGDDMERIRRCRKKFAHVNNPSISESLFTTLFSKFVEVAERAEKHLNKDMFVDRIKHYQTCTLDPEMESRFKTLEAQYKQEIAELNEELVKTKVKVGENVTVYMDRLTQSTIAESRGENYTEGTMKSSIQLSGIDNPGNTVALLNEREKEISTDGIVFTGAEEGCLVVFVDIAIGLLQNVSLLKREIESFIQRVFEVADFQCSSRENLEVFFSIIEESDSVLEKKADKVEYQKQKTIVAQAQAPREVDTHPDFFKKQKMECLKLCKTQFLIDESTFTCEEIGRPTTNHIYKCAWRANGQEPHKVLVRIYGKIATEQFPTFLINNLCVFLLLAKLDMGPKCYGFNDKGRIEELYVGAHLQRSQLKDDKFAGPIARKLAEIHEQDMPLPKAPTFLIDFCAPRIANIQRWLLTTKITETIVKTIDSLDFKQHLRSVVKATADLKSEVVFSHNGLTEGDILQLTEETDIKASLKLIDFEYSAYNYRAYDLSMLFIECCIDYRNVADTPYFKFNDKDYPGEEMRKHICKEYLKARSNTGYPTESDVKKLFHETEICELAVHLVWTIWGVDQHIRGQKISFGYLEYAVAHLEEYMKKQERIENQALKMQ